VAVPHLRLLPALAAAVALVLALTLVPATPAHAADRRPVERIQTLVEDRINAARAAKGLKPLKVNRRLERWATDHAGYMAANRTLVHDSLTRLRLEAPPHALSYSENIARNTADNAAKRAHQMFMRSGGHRANILDRQATHMGVGVIKHGGYTYIVQRFAALP
jgi:uncharacterized protein YkwD